ncbi:MAG: type VI secretion system membrane subunit TssM [Pyrinomonadaceae bacterium]
MSAQINQIKSLLGVSAILSFYGVASIGVWFLGSQFGLSVTMEIVLIALLLATLPFVLLFAYMRQKRAAAPPPPPSPSDLPAAQPAEEAKQPAQKIAAPTGTYTDMTNGAEEAVQWLKSTRLASVSKSDNALYALPWFMVTGPPASGKTSFVLSSGLNFHALPSQQGSDLQVIRPTRSCEWRVTDSAVLLDTTGRYQTESPARDEWSALIETVKKHRGARPLDGLLIAVSAEQLSRLKDTEVEQQAKLLRARVDEVLQRTKLRFPIYVVFTHIDAIDGFRDFFAAFGREERAQVWGATIPLQQAANAHALFDTEFDQLYDTLMHRRLVRLNAQLPPAQSIRIFNFPPRLGEVRGKLGLFASTLFRPTPFSESPLLRGFYFTANLNNARRGTGGSSSAPAALQQDAGDEARVLGEGFFADRFFKEVLLGDKDIAAAFQAQKRQPHYLRNLLIGLVGALLIFLAAGAIVSFFKNRKLIAEAVDRGSRVNSIAIQDSGKDPTKKAPAEARLEIEAVEDLRTTLAKLDEHEREGRPLSLRFGFYSGGVLSEKLRPIYFDSIGERFFEKTIKALETDLRTFASTSNVAALPAQNAAAAGSDSASAEEVLGRHYDLLKAYLMLGDPSKVEPTFLADQLSFYWTRFAPPDQESAALKQLEFYARQAIHDDAPHNKPDELLVSQARRKLAAYPAANRFYKRITTEINAKAASVNLDTILQGSGGGVLSGTYTVPGSFTVEGYRKHITAAINSASEEISKDDWVMGGAASAAEAKAQSDDTGKLQSMYFRDYTDHWRKFLKNTSVNEYKTRDDAVEALKAMSASDSPLQRVLESVTHNTRLSAEAESTGFVAWVKSFFADKEDEETSAPATEVEREFRPLFQFIPAKSTKETTPISQYKASLLAVQESVDSASNEQFAQTSKALLTGKDEIGLQKGEQNITKLLDGFKTPAAVDAAALLKQPLGNLRRLTLGKIQEVMIANWRDQVFPKAKVIESGFPFTEVGESSVADIARYLNPTNGQLTTFFNSQLAPSFEEAQGQWKLKEAGDVKFSEDFVNYLNNARRLREALFPSAGAQAEVSYEITLQPLPDADVILEIDGQRVESRGTSSAKFMWPARSGSATGATIKVVPTTGGKWWTRLHRSHTLANGVSSRCFFRALRRERPMASLHSLGT